MMKKDNGNGVTREEFYKKVNEGRYPKYVLSQIKEGKPKKDCSTIVCTASDKILLAKYENGNGIKRILEVLHLDTHLKVCITPALRMM